MLSVDHPHMSGPGRAEGRPVEFLRASPFIELRHASTSRSIEVVVPERRFLSIEGCGRDTASGFELATAMLRGAAIALRERLFRDRFDTGHIGILECTWSRQPIPAADEMEASFDDRSTWRWRQLIAIPSAASDDDVRYAIAEASHRVGRSAELVQLLIFREGRAVQILHVGGSATEGATVVRLFGAIAEAGLHACGSIHELRVADEPHANPSRTRTIIRVPVQAT